MEFKIKLNFSIKGNECFENRSEIKEDYRNRTNIAMLPLLKSVQ